MRDCSAQAPFPFVTVRKLIIIFNLPMVISIDTRLKYLLDQNHILFILIKTFLNETFLKIFYKVPKELLLTPQRETYPLKKLGHETKVGDKFKNLKCDRILKFLKLPLSRIANCLYILRVANSHVDSVTPFRSMILLCQRSSHFSNK